MKCACALLVLLYGGKKMSLKETKKIDTNRYQLEITVDGEKFREAIRGLTRKTARR